MRKWTQARAAAARRRLLAAPLLVCSHPASAGRPVPCTLAPAFPPPARATGLQGVPRGAAQGRRLQGVQGRGGRQGQGRQGCAGARACAALPSRPHNAGPRPARPTAARCVARRECADQGRPPPPLNPTPQRPAAALAAAAARAPSWRTTRSTTPTRRCTSAATWCPPRWPACSRQASRQSSSCRPASPRVRRPAWAGGQGGPPPRGSHTALTSGTAARAPAHLRSRAPARPARQHDAV